MLEGLLNNLKEKSILILGFGVEGKSTYSFIRKHFPKKQITICDEKIGYEKELVQDENVKCIHSNEYLEHTQEYDLIFKTPGISFKDIDISGFQNKITSELEMVLEFVDIFTIGITGTKGKSTTSSLMYSVLEKNKKDTMLLGNIGVPIFEKLDEMNKDTILVLELSSHALQYIKKAPNIAILLNVFEEHLDHYKSYDEYIDAKYNVFKFQNENDYALYNIDNDIISKRQVQTKANKITVSMESKDADVTLNGNEIYYKEKLVYVDDEKRHILGNHNLNNIMFAVTVSDILNLDFNLTKQAIDEFMPLEHRMEYVGKFNNVEYYNDSIATIPEATINAIETLKNINTLIVGGKDRGVHLGSLIDYINKSKIENIICLPKTGEYIAKEMKNKQVFLVENLSQAVEIAKEKTKKGTICLLSPAASSYGYFKNFKERGNLFKQYVKA